MQADNNDPPEVETQITQTEPGSEINDTSEDMTAWSYDRQERVKSLVTATFSNQSSYGPLVGMVGSRQYNEPTESWVSVVEPDPAQVWDESRAMSALSADAETKRSLLLTKEFINESSFEMPDGFGTHGQVGTVTSSPLGVWWSGTFLDTDGLPLSGTATLTDGKYISAEETVTGSATVTAGPPPNALFGESADGILRLTFVFDPAIAGVAYVEDDYNLALDAGSIQYGDLIGQINDYNGDAVPGDAVSGPEFGTTTDEDGQFQIIAPGGEQTPFTVFDQTFSDEVSITAGDTETATFTYPELTIKVVDPDYQPIENAPVKINDQLAETDAQGRVEIFAAPLGTYEIEVMDRFEATIDIDQADTRYFYQLGPDASEVTWDGVEDGVGGIAFKFIDQVTGRPIRALRAVDRSSRASARSDENGDCTLLTPQTGGEVDILIGDGDNRYKTRQIETEMPETETVEATIELEPKTVVSNT